MHVHHNEGADGVLMYLRTESYEDVLARPELVIWMDLEVDIPPIPCFFWTSKGYKQVKSRHGRRNLALCTINL